MALHSTDNQTVLTLDPTVGVSPPTVFLSAGKNFIFAFMSINDPGASMTTLSILTPRELEILQLILAGYTNKAIAAAVFISEKTVEFHLDNIYTKIGVRTRLMAGVWALQQGLSVETREFPS